MSSLRVLALAALFAAVATPARADGTLFLGANTTPESRRVQGFSLGFGLLVVGVEFEYANTPQSDEPVPAAPSLKTGSGNVLLQTPFAIYGFQPYFTFGAGYYSESLGARDDSGFAPNTGGGVKISLAGPLRLRVDYRVFKLGDSALYSPVHRLYAGLNLKF
jgi:hypothetical protein